MQIDVRKMTPGERLAYLDNATERARALADPAQIAIFVPFLELLKFVVESDYCGGCHDTSAVLHMLLTEVGVESTLCIGEVGAGRFFFDHSWVEVDGRVFDVAVCMPHPEGEPVGGPVFGNIDLATGVQTSLRYGAESGDGLGAAAQPALVLDLQGYSTIQPNPNIWILAVAMASRCGEPNATFKHFMDRYGHVRRTPRTVQYESTI